jgi:hypothetical protein
MTGTINPDGSAGPVSGSSKDAGGARSGLAFRLSDWHAQYKDLKTGVLSISWP